METRSQSLIKKELQTPKEENLTELEKQALEKVLTDVQKGGFRSGSEEAILDHIVALGNKTKCLFNVHVRKYGYRAPDNWTARVSVTDHSSIDGLYRDFSVFYDERTGRSQARFSLERRSGNKIHMVEEKSELAKEQQIPMLYEILATSPSLIDTAYLMDWIHDDSSKKALSVTWNNPVNEAHGFDWSDYNRLFNERLHAEKTTTVS